MNSLKGTGRCTNAFFADRFVIHIINVAEGANGGTSGRVKTCVVGI